MNEELELIVQRMIEAGESEDNIKLVIENYNVKKKDSSQQDLQTPAEPLSKNGKEIKRRLTERIGLRQEGESEDDFRNRAKQAREDLIEESKAVASVEEEPQPTITLGTIEGDKVLFDQIDKLKRIQNEIKETQPYLDQDNQISGFMQDNTFITPADNTFVPKENPDFKVLQDEGALTFKNARKAFKADYLDSNPDVVADLQSGDAEKIEEANKKIYKAFSQNEDIGYAASQDIAMEEANLIDMTQGGLTFNTTALESMYNSFKEGMDERDFNIAMAKEIALAEDEEEVAKILELEYERSLEQAADIQKPEPGMMSKEGLSKMTGTQAVPIATTIALNFLPGIGKPASVLYSGIDAGATSYGAAARSVYIQARNEGFSEEEALRISKKESEVQAATGFFEGAVGAYTGGLASKTGKYASKFSSKKLSALINSAVTGTTDMGVDAGVAAVSQIVNNASMKDQGLQVDLLDGVKEEMMGEIIFSSGMKIPSGVKTVADFKSYVNELPPAEQQKVFNKVVDSSKNLEENLTRNRTNVYLNMLRDDAIKNKDKEALKNIQLNPQEVLAKEIDRAKVISASLTSDQARSEVNDNIKALELMMKSLDEGETKTTESIKVFKGVGGKETATGEHLTVHPKAEGVFSATDENLAKDYAREGEVVETVIPEGATVETVEIDGKGMTPEEYRDAETEAINNSQAQVVKLITTDGKITKDQKKQEHYVIKDESIVESLKAPEVKTEEVVEEGVKAPILSRKIRAKDGSGRKGLVPTEELESFIGEDRLGDAAMTTSRETIDELKEDIKKNGFKEPVVVVYDPITKQASILEGNHRMAAAKELGLEEVPVRFEKGTLRSDESRAKDKMFPLNRVDVGEINTRFGVKGEDLGLTVRQPVESDYVPETKVVKPGKKLFSEPNPETIEISREYKEKKGIDTEDGSPINKLDVEKSKEIADAFEDMKHDPNSPEVIESYNEMAKETIDQYGEISDKGYKFEVYEGEGEPYKNSEEMIADVRDNKHLYILATDKEFGGVEITDQQRAENPLLADSGIKDVNGKPLLVNDVFRGVHDFFGHSERGNSFGAIGEENAWDIHARMYSPKARRAMTTETRGQNSWVNSGKQMRNEDGSIKKKGDEGYMGPTERPFAEQKIGLLPEKYSNLDSPKKQGPKVFNSAKETGIVEYRGEPMPENDIKKSIKAYQSDIEAGMSKSDASISGLAVMKDTDWYKNLSSDEKRKAFDQDYKKSLGVDLGLEDKVKLPKEDNPFIKKKARTLFKEKIKNLAEGAKLGAIITKAELKKVHGELLDYANARLKGLGATDNSRKVIGNRIKNSNRKNMEETLAYIDSIADKYLEKSRQKTIAKIVKTVKNKRSVLTKKGTKWVAKVPIDVQDFIKKFDTSDLESLTKEEAEAVLQGIEQVLTDGRKANKVVERAMKARKNRAEAESFLAYHNGEAKEVSGLDALNNEFESNKKTVAIVDGQKITSKNGLKEALKDREDVDLNNIKVYRSKNIQNVKDETSNTVYDKIRSFINPIYRSANLKNNLSFLAKGNRAGRLHVEEISNKVSEAELDFSDFSSRITKDFVKKVAKIFVPKSIAGIGAKSHYIARRLAKETISKGDALKMKQGIDSNIKLTNDRLVNWYNISKMKDGKKALESQGVDLEILNNHMDANPDLKAFSDFLIDEFYKTLKERYEPVYTKLTGRKFDEGMYYPMYRVSMMNDFTKAETLYDDNGSTQSLKPLAGSLNERVNNNADIDLTKGAFDVAKDYVRTMERSKQFIPVGERINEIFNKEAIPGMIEKVGTKNFKNIEDHLVTVITGKSPRKSSSLDNEVINTIMGVKVFASLAGKPVSAVKQLTSAGRYTTAEDVSLVEFGKALSGPLNKNEIDLVKHIVLKEDYVIDRFRGAGFDLEAEKLAKKGVTMTKNIVARQASKIGMLPTSIGDIGGVLVGGVPYSIAVYRQKIKGGMSHEDAKNHAYKRFRAVSKETQQSTKGSEVSHMQRSALGRLFSMYTTSQKQGVNKMIYSAKMLASNTDLTSKEKGRHLYNILYYSGENMFFGMVANGYVQTLYEAAIGEGDEEEFKKGAYDTVMDNFQSLLSGTAYNGYLLNMLVSSMRGDDWKNELPIYQEMKRISDMAEVLISLRLEGKSPEDMTDAEINTIVKGLPVDGFIKTFKDFNKASKGEKSFGEAFMSWRSDEEKRTSRPKNDKIYKSLFNKSYSGNDMSESEKKKQEANEKKAKLKKK